MSLAEKLEKDEIHARLVNWGRWLRYDGTVARLGYPTEAPFVFSPRKGQCIADLDAEHMEWIISGMYVSNDPSPMGTLYAFILRINYAERPQSAMPPQSQLAEDVRRRFKRPCSERSYRRHLFNAKNAVMTRADPIK